MHGILVYIFSAMPIMKKKAKPKRWKTVPRVQRKRLQWSNKSMETAMEAVMNGKTSINKAGVMYNVPCTSLKDRLSRKLVHGTRSGPKRYLNEIEEKELADHLIEVASIGYGKTRREVILITKKVAREKKSALKGSCIRWMVETI